MMSLNGLSENENIQEIIRNMSNAERRIGIRMENLVHTVRNNETNSTLIIRKIAGAIIVENSRNVVSRNYSLVAAVRYIVKHGYYDHVRSVEAK